MAPERAAIAKGPSCQCVPLASNKKRPTKSDAVMSSLQATVINGLFNFQAMYSTKRVLPQPVGPFNIIGMRTE